MPTIDTTAIESLRTFAVDHNELPFAHLCTAALAGEQWAVERIVPVVERHEIAIEVYGDKRTVLEMIRATDTTRPRPDGATARGGNARDRRQRGARQADRSCAGQGDVLMTALVKPEDLTDEMIRELEREGRQLIAMTVAAKTPHRGQMAARAACATAINARRTKEQP